MVKTCCNFLTLAFSIHRQFFKVGIQISLAFSLQLIFSSSSQTWKIVSSKKKNSRLFFDSYNFIISLIHQKVLSANTLSKYYHILVDSSSIWITPAYFLFECLVSLYSLTFQYPKFSPIIRDKSFRTIKDSQNSLLLIFFIKMMNSAWT